MNNLYAWKQIVPAKFFAVITVVSLILSAFPAHFFVAEAQGPPEKVKICKANQSPALGGFVPGVIEVNENAIKEGLANSGINGDIVENGQNWDFVYPNGLTGEEIFNADCDVVISGSISGAKYDDAGNDGSIDGDSKLAGWDIRLYKVDTPWDLIDTDTTDVNGEYEFNDLPEGEYKVCEVMKDDWTQTFVTNGTTNESPNSSEEGPKCQTVNIDEDDEENTKNFGNHYEEPVDFCDPSQKPGGKSIAQWHEENQFDGTDCFDFEVVQQCGSLDVQFTRNDSTLGFTFLYVLGSETPESLENAESFPASFPEDENGGTVELTYFVVGAEEDYFTGSDVPNFWDGNGTTVSINTDCEEEAPVCQIGENLLSNGSFEDPEVTDDKKWRYTDIIDWVITALSDDEEQDGELHRGWSSNEAAHGEQYAELDSRESVKMSQTVPTVEGATYELKWAFAPRHGLNAVENQLSVLVDGSEVETEGPATLPAGLDASDWTRNSYTFKAGSDETTVSFADAGANSNSLGTFLDDTALCFVADPEPEEPEVCSSEGKVIEYSDPAYKNNGNPVDADRRDPTNVEDGVAGYNNWGSKESGWSTDDFFSLGIEGHLIYEFTSKIAVDQPGPDIAIWEITGGNSGQTDEKVEVSVSQDGVNFVYLETVTGDAAVDIAPAGLDFVKYVKLVDDSVGVQGGNGDGFDVDAITIIEGSCEDYLNIHTTKIVCTDEADLPNWGNGGNNITADTAADWISEDHPSCEIVEGWEFEWGPKTAPDPGDSTVGTAGGPWTTFTGSTMVPASAFANGHLWMREVLQEGYIPFTHEAEGKKNTDDYTAEFYCHTDVLNYDNYDRIDGPQAGGDYYCVGWNVPEEVPEPYQCEAGLLFLDTETEESDEIMSLHTVDESDGTSSFWGEYEDLKLFPVLAVDADEVVYSIDKTSGDLVTLDDNLGGYSVVGDTGLDLKKPVAMEVAPNGTMYALTENNDALYSVDTTSGDADKLHDLDLTVAGGDVVFDGNTIVYIKNTGQVYAIDHVTFDETLLGTLSVGSKRITSAAEKDGTFYAYTREDSFHPFTLNPFVEETATTQTGPFAWGDGSFCPAPPVPEQCSLDIVSDTGTVVIENNAFAVETYDNNNAWTADLNDGNDAIWVWESYEVVDPEVDRTLTFKETFEVTGGMNANLSIAADNSYIAWLNGNVVIDQTTENSNFGVLNQDEDIDVTSFLQDGTNTLLIEVTNNGVDGANYVQNPAGVLYRLTLEGDPNSCDVTTDLEEDKKYLIDGYKYEGEYGDENPTVPGWPIYLYEGDTDNELMSTTTDEDGYYYFWVMEGDYRVEEGSLTGWYQVGVAEDDDYDYTDDKDLYCFFDIGDYDHDVFRVSEALNNYDEYPEEEEGYSCDFYNEQDDDTPPQRLHYIDGYKYDVTDDQRVPLAGWTIYASNGVDTPLSTTTDSNGYYYFELPAGDWEIYEGSQPGWTQVGAEQNGSPAFGLSCEFEFGVVNDSIDYFVQEGPSCNFLNEQDQVITTTGGGGGSSGTRIRDAGPQPLVAGASTDFCPLINDFMQIGIDNDPWEVLKLQLFLNLFVAETPVTGVFDATTDANVKLFQEEHRDEILDPWFELGIVPHNRPTGFVYKLTKWKINDIVCPGEEPYPSLEGEDLSSNVDLD